MDETEKPGCPKCGALITTLNAYAKEESHYIVYLDSAKFDPDLDSLGYDYQQCVEGSTTHTDFKCPKCEATLFSSKVPTGPWTGTSWSDTQPQDVIDFLRKANVIPEDEVVPDDEVVE